MKRPNFTALLAIVFIGGLICTLTLPEDGVIPLGAIGFCGLLVCSMVVQAESATYHTGFWKILFFGFIRDSSPVKPSPYVKAMWVAAALTLGVLAGIAVLVNA